MTTLAPAGMGETKGGEGEHKLRVRTGVNVKQKNGMTGMTGVTGMKGLKGGGHKRALTWVRIEQAADVGNERLGDCVP